MREQLALIMQKIVVSVVLTAVMLTPLWAFMLIRHFLNPEGFWQQIVTVGLGFWIFGGVQILMGIALLYFLVSLWSWKGRIW